MRIDLCSHWVDSRLGQLTPVGFYIWGRLMNAASKNIAPSTDGYIYIHRNFVHKFLRVTEQEFEESLKFMKENSYWDKGGKMVTENGNFLHIEQWNCHCIKKFRVPVPADVKAAILSAGECKHCGTSENLCVDHITPVSMGGGNEIENLQCLCRSCNSKKGAKFVG